jgi:hypothetical protein
LNDGHHKVYIAGHVRKAEKLEGNVYGHKRREI